jgi:signal transduction histidine kinase
MIKFIRKHKRLKNPPPVILTLVFAILVFVILVITMVIVGIFVIVLNKLQFINSINAPNIWIPTIWFASASILTGTVVAIILSHIPLKPINTIIHGMNQLANGKYQTRIDLGHISLAKGISNSFNTLAEELENTEMLRSDFVNNFSHEFKTPIVSICGFAKLLQRDTISKEKQKEYLNIIVEESTRLSEMATNVLNLTKVEYQSILTDISRFNLSEQLRNSVLMLENKWMQKGISITVEFNEYYIEACEELLKQVWINILDNSIKFSPTHSEIEIELMEEHDLFTVSIINHGPEMSQEEMKRIYDKFWQGDTSHASEGTGIGLSIAKRIVELHKGKIDVYSSKEQTKFSVILPNRVS